MVEAVRAGEPDRAADELAKRQRIIAMYLSEHAKPAAQGSAVRFPLERFVGYLHILGSLFIGLVDFWRDPNRRLAHDRVAHTAVLRNVRPASNARK